MSLILHALDPNRPIEECRQIVDRQKAAFRWTAGEGPQKRQETIQTATTRHLFYLLRSVVRKSREIGSTPLFKRVSGNRVIPNRKGGEVVVLALDEIQLRGDLEAKLVTELNQLLPLAFDNETLFNLRRNLQSQGLPQSFATQRPIELNRPVPPPQFPPNYRQEPQFPLATGDLARDIERRQQKVLEKPQPKEVTELTQIGRRKIQTD